MDLRSTSGNSLIEAVFASLLNGAGKVGLLLLVAACACWALRRGSAAVRHLVWAGALAAGLALPILSLTLPHWRVLPTWAESRRPTPYVVESVGAVAIGEVRPERVLPPDFVPAAPEATAAAPLLLANPPPTVSWAGVLLAAWASGAVLMLIPVARSFLALRRFAKQSTIVNAGPLAASTTRVARRLGVPAPIVLLGPAGAMPMVWGLGRGRLLLPAEAPGWAEPALETVLLHELAHLRRWDPRTIFVAQLSRAVHWFNPLAWLAVQRMRVEQERACDDIVLDAGVRPSEYAKQLLDIGRRLLPAAPAGGLGLAMAQRCRIEGRLSRILDAACNRRGATRGLIATTLLLFAAAAPVLAVLRAAEAFGGAEQAGGPAETKEKAEAVQPKTQATKDFLAAIQFRRNKDGSYPAAALEALRAEIEKQQQKLPAWRDFDLAKGWLEKTAKKHDWTEAELVLLLDEAAVWSLPVVAWAEFGERSAEMNTVKPGRAATTDELRGLAFGPPAPNGLRVAWVLEPVRMEYRLGEILKCRIVFQNAGKDPVQLVTETWHQQDVWNVRNAKGEEVKTEGVWYTGTTPHQRYRLEPGQIAEASAPGVAIGKGDYEEQFSTAAIGKVVLAKAGDDLRITWTVRTPGVVINSAKGRDVPTEGDWVGSLTTGEVKFRVLAPDPNAKSGLGAATGPGRYTLAPGVRMQVSRTTHPDGSFTNTAAILWLAADAATTKQHPVHLPDGLSTFAIVWQRGASILWIAEKESFRRIDFTDPALVKEERWARNDHVQVVPEEIRKKLDESFPKPVAPPALAIAPLPKSTAPVVLGLDMATAPTAAVQPREIPDLWEPDPGSPGFWRQRTGVFEMPLDEHAWLKYPVALRRFYIEHRQDREKPETERTYGPFPGDPFDRFNLEAVLKQKLQVENGDADALYRLALMLRTGDVGLARRAVRLMQEALDGSAEVYRKESTLAGLRELLAKYAAVLQREEFAASVTNVKGRIAAVEAEIERLTDALRDEQYTHPDAAAIKSPPIVPADAWGLPKEGLRAAAVPGSTNVSAGEQFAFRLVVENISDHVVKFAATDLIQDAKPSVERADGGKVRSNSTWFSGWKIPQHYLLKPGERIELAAPGLLFAGPGTSAGLHGCTAVAAGAGRYRVTFNFSLGLGSHWSRAGDGLMHRTVPAKGEWSGSLTTGAIIVTVR